jgi:hypothetical protein
MTPNAPARANAQVGGIVRLLVLASGRRPSRLPLSEACALRHELPGRETIGHPDAHWQDQLCCGSCALAGVIKLISDLFPEEPAFPAPLIQLRQDLDDLERGKVAPFFEPVKVAHRPPTALSEELFRAIAAAAMTRLMEDKDLSRDNAARDVAGRFSRMGAKSSGEAITARQIAKWREKMMTDWPRKTRPWRDISSPSKWWPGWRLLKAVALMLGSLTDMSPAKPPLNGSPKERCVPPVQT